MSVRCRLGRHYWEARRYNWYAKPRAFREQSCGRCATRRTQILSDFVDYIECPGSIQYQWVTIAHRWLPEWPGPRTAS